MVTYTETRMYIYGVPYFIISKLTGYHFRNRNIDIEWYNGALEEDILRMMTAWVSGENGSRLLSVSFGGMKKAADWKDVYDESYPLIQ